MYVAMAETVADGAMTLWLDDDCYTPPSTLAPFPTTILSFQILPAIVSRLQPFHTEWTASMR